MGLELQDSVYSELEAKAAHLQIDGLEILEAPPNLHASELEAISELGGEEIAEAPGAVLKRISSGEVGKVITSGE